MCVRDTRVQLLVVFPKANGASHRWGRRRRRRKWWQTDSPFGATDGAGGSSDSEVAEDEDHAACFEVSPHMFKPKINNRGNIQRPAFSFADIIKYQDLRGLFKRIGK